MIRFMSRILPLLALLLSACGTSQPASSPVHFDLGPLPPAAAAPALAPLALAPLTAPAGLDTAAMLYRLDYAEPQRARSYAGSRWQAPPAELFEQRFKARVGQAGGALLRPGDGLAGIPVLRIELDQFIQVFESASQSSALLSLRVSLLDDERRALIGHRSFTQKVAADGTDAGAGARALARASDAAIDDIMAWLAALPRKQ